jgi:hypothetical protein
MEGMRLNALPQRRAVTSEALRQVIEVVVGRRWWIW